MDNPRFGDDENIPLVQDEDIGYDDYDTTDTSRLDETSFTMPSSREKETTSTLRLKRKVKQDKLAALYKHLSLMGNLDLINLDRFKLAKDPKKGPTIVEFYDGDR